MRRLMACTTLLLASSLLQPCARAGTEAKVDVTVVKYSGLADAVKQLKGRVVVIDFWAEW